MGSALEIIQTLHFGEESVPGPLDLGIYSVVRTRFSHSLDDPLPIPIFSSAGV